MNLEQIKQKYAEGALEGIYDGVDNDVYHHAECPGRSSSFLKRLKSKSPAHAVAELKNPKPATPAMQFGTAFHDCILLPDLFARTYKVPPKVDRRTKEGKATWEAFQSDNPGAKILDEDEMTRLLAMRESVMAHPKLSELFDGATFEQSCWRKDPETGLMLKVRPDLLYTKDIAIVVDFKTCDSADRDSFALSCQKYGYDLSAAMYLDVLGMQLGQELDLFVLAAVEKQPPFAVVPYVLGGASLEKGMRDYQAAKRVAAECERTGDWYGYGKEFKDLELPSWAFGLGEVELTA